MEHLSSCKHKFEKAICLIRSGLDDIIERNPCECTCDVKHGICCIEKGIKETEEGIICIETHVGEFFREEIARFSIAIAKIGVALCLEGIRAFKNCDVDRGVRLTELGLFLLEIVLRILREHEIESDCDCGCEGIA